MFPRLNPRVNWQFLYIYTIFPHIWSRDLEPFIGFLSSPQQQQPPFISIDKLVIPQNPFAGHLSVNVNREDTQLFNYLMKTFFVRLTSTWTPSLFPRVFFELNSFAIFSIEINNRNSRFMFSMCRAGACVIGGKEGVHASHRMARCFFQLHFPGNKEAAPMTSSHWEKKGAAVGGSFFLHTATRTEHHKNVRSRFRFILLLFSLSAPLKPLPL